MKLRPTRPVPLAGTGTPRLLTVLRWRRAMAITRLLEDSLEARVTEVRAVRRRWRGWALRRWGLLRRRCGRCCTGFDRPFLPLFRTHGLLPPCLITPLALIRRSISRLPPRTHSCITLLLDIHCNPYGWWRCIYCISTSRHNTLSLSNDLLMRLVQHVHGSSSESCCCFAHLDVGQVLQWKLSFGRATGPRLQSRRGYGSAGVWSQVFSQTLICFLQ